MKNKDEIAKRIIDKLIDDMHDRSAIGDALYSIDDVVLDEIVGAWTKIIKKELP